MSGPRAMRPVTIFTDLLLILLGFLGGVGLERVLLTPDPAHHAAVTVLATPPAASRLATAPAWERPRTGIAPAGAGSGNGSAPAVRPSPALPPAATQVAAAAARTNPGDLRLDLQRLARWPLPTEVPAGQKRYPAASDPTPDGQLMNP